MLASDCLPIEQLIRHDADMHFAFLSGNGVVYTEPSTDAWYRVASLPTNVGGSSADESTFETVYLPLEPASPLGCTDQYQICTATSCGRLASLRDALADAALLFNSSYAVIAENSEGTTERAALFGYLGNTLFQSKPSIDRVLSHLGQRALASHRDLIGSFQGPLAPNQWQVDITNLWNISMAATQSAFIDTAYGPTDPKVLEMWFKYTGSHTNTFCNNQVIVLLLFMTPLGEAPDSQYRQLTFRLESSKYFIRLIQYVRSLFYLHRRRSPGSDILSPATRVRASLQEERV
jgi:hypothetical protein